MKSVDLDILRQDWEGVATTLKNDFGGSLLLAGSEDFIPGGIFVHGTATARLNKGLMEGSGSHPGTWCIHPSDLPSMEEVAAKVRMNRCLVLGRYEDEIYLVLLDKEATEVQDRWHGDLVRSLGELLGSKGIKTPMVEVTQAEAKALQEVYSYLRLYGSFDPPADFRAVMSSSIIANLPMNELYRVLMEPVFNHQGENDELAVTAFRPVRDLWAAEVYNWLHHFKCIDCGDPFSDVEYVLDKSRHGCWRLYDSDLRGKRLFFLNRDEIYQETIGSDKELALEYIVIPDSLLFEDVERTGDTSNVVQMSDIVVTSGFPTDPVHEYYQRR